MNISEWSILVVISNFFFFFMYTLGWYVGGKGRSPVEGDLLWFLYLQDERQGGLQEGVTGRTRTTGIESVLGGVVKRGVGSEVNGRGSSFTT